MPRYLIAYDIADPRRLQKVARRMEKSAMRVQKSVFLTQLIEPELDRLLEDLTKLIHPSEDVVQAWTLSAGQPAEGQVCGTAVPVQPHCIIHGASHTQTFLSSPS